MMQMPTRVLVSGATGFIGSALVGALAAKGHEIHLLVRRDVLPSHLDALRHRCVLHRADLLHAQAVRAAVRASRPAIVYHLAAEGVSSVSSARRTDVLNANILGTANLLDALHDCPYRAFVAAGSGFEYGPSFDALSEESPLRPMTDYAVAKAACSLLCQSEARRGRPVSVVRIFGAYGPGEGPPRLVPYLMECCLRGETARVSSGTQQRDWIHVDDVVDLLQAAAVSPEAIGQVLHAGTGKAHTVRETIEAILEVTGTAIPVLFGAQEMRAGEPQCFFANIERTQQVTEWSPRFSLRLGLKHTWDWFCANAAAQRAWRRAV
jgi:nucleoside-diphosphate-sugar epimerase